MRVLGNMIGASKVHHASYLVKTGKLDEAVGFFRELRWRLVNEVVGDWGRAKFVKIGYQDISVQLTEYADRDPSLQTCTDDAHLAIAVQVVTAEMAANSMLLWAIGHKLDEGARIEIGNSDGTKWLVYLPAIFTFAIEVVKVKDLRYS